MKKLIFLVVIILILLTSCTYPFTPYDSTETNISSTDNAPVTQYNQNDGSYFRVYFIDVGQADCALIQCDGKSMLVDAGNVSDSQLVYTFLTKHGVKKLDIVIGTHAHEDHMGAMATVINKFDVLKFFTTRTTSYSSYYINLSSALHKKGIVPKTPEPLDKISLGSAEITFLSPYFESEDDINNTSIVFRIVYGNTSFLFTGDAERNSELMMINSSAELKSDVLKVSHHGSHDSTSYGFLNEVLPQYAVISCGKNNDYGHPHEETLSRLEDADAVILRTDLLGDIIFTSDGNTVRQVIEDTEINTDTDTQALYIGNINSRIFHKDTCTGLPAEKNRVYFSTSDEALEQGYTPCGNCKP